MTLDTQNSMGGFFSDNAGDIIVELNDVDLAHETSDPAIRRAQEAIRRKLAEEYLEKLKKYRPGEYEEVIKERNQRKKKPDGKSQEPGSE